MSHWYFKLIDDENDFEIICDNILPFQIGALAFEIFFDMTRYYIFLVLENMIDCDKINQNTINVRWRCKNVIESTIDSTVFK